MVKFVWHHSIDRPRNPPPLYGKISGDISHISRLIADFIPNFVAMATGVDCGRICLTLFNTATPTTPY